MLQTLGKQQTWEPFHYWMDTECSLFRIYCLGRTDDVAVIPPYNPSSRRGVTRIHLQVTNKMAGNNSNNPNPTIIHVYWVDYQGREINKGTIRPHETWHQQTWVEHPWIFRTAQDNPTSGSSTILLHYIPYRVIPTTRLVRTNLANEPTLGVHAFEIHDPAPPVWGEPITPSCCRVVDKVMPFPSAQYLTTLSAVLDWTLHHVCLRMQWNQYSVVQKYLTNILEHPDVIRYRQIRLANPHFFHNIWNTSARGLLLAIGFVEHLGYAELGSSESLPRELLQRVQTLLLQLNEWQRQCEFEGTQVDQPEGADGYGLAGFGRAGALNDPTL